MNPVEGEPRRGHSVTLRLRRRSVETLGTRASPSLFARLSPSVVEGLAKGTSYAVGAVSSSRGKQHIDFLPLSVRFEDDSTIYVSYNGGIVDSEGEPN